MTLDRNTLVRAARRHLRLASLRAWLMAARIQRRVLERLHAQGWANDLDLVLAVRVQAHIEADIIAMRLQE